MCDDTECEYGALVGGECGSSARYLNTENLPIRECSRSIAGFQCHAVQQIKARIWEMKGGPYTKALAKIQVRGRFRTRDIRRNVLPKLIEICMETPCWCSPG